MDKINLKTSLPPKFCLLAISLIFTACSSIKIVTVKNNTDESINFQGQFITKSNNTDKLEFVLKPGKINSWTYEIGAFENDRLDKGLNRILLSDPKGCTVVLERNSIEKIAKKNGMWVIIVDNNVMNCN